MGEGDFVATFGVNNTPIYVLLWLVLGGPHYTGVVLVW